MQAPRTTKVIFLLAMTMATVDVAQAFGFGNMMNPSRWMGGDRDRDDDYYGAAPYGYGYPGGYAAPGYAPPGYVQPGYAAPGYGYGYGAPVYPAPVIAAPAPAAVPAPVVAAPAPAAKAAAAKPPPVLTADEAEIARLQKRIRELEAAGETPVYTVPTGTGSAGSATSAYPDSSPYNQDYRFPDSTQGHAAPAAAEAAPRAVKAQPEYPVYSPFGPPAEFPPLEPEPAAATEDKAVAAPVAAPAASAAPVAAKSVEVEAPPAAEPTVPAGVVNFTPGNPAAYVPPMQNTGQRVYELGR